MTLPLHYNATLITKAFPQLTAIQQAQFAALGPLYVEWNARLNLISRRDIANLYLHHVLHSLAIVKVVTFLPGTAVLDIGTGGGFPGIPLAILFPAVHFTLVDSIGKKAKAAAAIAAALELPHVTVAQVRAEAMDTTYDFVVGRAVTALPTLWGWAKGRLACQQRHPLPNGLLYLQGGPVRLPDDPEVVCTSYALADHFGDPYFATKELLHLHLTS